MLQVAVSPEPTTLTSAVITTVNIGMVSSKALEGLVAYDLNLNPVPALTPPAAKAAASATPPPLLRSLDSGHRVACHLV